MQLPIALDTTSVSESAIPVPTEIDSSSKKSLNFGALLTQIVSENSNSSDKAKINANEKTTKGKKSQSTDDETSDSSADGISVAMIMPISVQVEATIPQTSELSGQNLISTALMDTTSMDNPSKSSNDENIPSIASRIEGALKVDSNTTSSNPLIFQSGQKISTAVPSESEFIADDTINANAPTLRFVETMRIDSQDQVKAPAKQAASLAEGLPFATNTDVPEAKAKQESTSSPVVAQVEVASFAGLENKLTDGGDSVPNGNNAEGKDKQIKGIQLNNQIDDVITPDLGDSREILTETHKSGLPINTRQSQSMEDAADSIPEVPRNIIAVARMTSNSHEMFPDDSKSLQGESTLGRKPSDDDVMLHSDGANEDSKSSQSKIKVPEPIESVATSNSRDQQTQSVWLHLDTPSVLPNATRTERIDTDAKQPIETRSISKDVKDEVKDGQGADRRITERQTDTSNGVPEKAKIPLGNHHLEGMGATTGNGDGSHSGGGGSFEGSRKNQWDYVSVATPTGAVSQSVNVSDTSHASMNTQLANNEKNEGVIVDAPNTFNPVLNRDAAESPTAKVAMHFNLQSETLGDVSVRAVLQRSEVGANIEVHSTEARAMLEAGLPLLTRSLDEKGIDLRNFSVSQGSADVFGQSHERQKDGQQSEPQYRRSPIYQSSISLRNELVVNETQIGGATLARISLIA